MKKDLFAAIDKFTAVASWDACVCFILLPVNRSADSSIAASIDIYRRLESRDVDLRLTFESGDSHSREESTGKYGINIIFGLALHAYYSNFIVAVKAQELIIIYILNVLWITSFLPTPWRKIVAGATDFRGYSAAKQALFTACYYIERKHACHQLNFSSSRALNIVIVFPKERKTLLWYPASILTKKYTQIFKIKSEKLSSLEFNKRSR